MDFEEYMAKNYSGDFDMPHPRDAYEAGQQSKQAEIDVLKSKIDGAIKYLSRGGYTPNWLVKELLK